MNTKTWYFAQKLFVSPSPLVDALIAVPAAAIAAVASVREMPSESEGTEELSEAAGARAVAPMLGGTCAPAKPRSEEA